MIGVWEYIESTRDKVRDLERRVRLAKANVEQMHNIMTGWSQSPLFRRKEDKKDTLLNLEVCKCIYVKCSHTGMVHMCVPTDFLLPNQFSFTQRAASNHSNYMYMYMYMVFLPFLGS